MALTLALILDAMLGEPKWLWSRFPHPAVLMGNLIDLADQKFNSGQARKTKGAALMAALCIAMFILGMAFAALPGVWAEIIIAAILFAQRSLVDHVSAVADELGLGLEQGRSAVAMIVGRETAMMDEPAIARAAIESAAENFSDGIVAPVFWFALTGLPGLLIYKITNTADSMIGYRNEKYADFGWAAARFDDLLNWLPARLSALIITVASGIPGAALSLRRDAALHRSPNAGWPEAAMARALGVALAGPRKYDGFMQDFPWVNENARKMLRSEDIRNSVQLLWKSWSVLLLVAIILWLA